MIARDREATLTVLHVNLYQNGKNVTRMELKKGIEAAFGPLENVRCVVRPGFLVEESILEEVAAEAADIVVIGEKQVSRWQQLLRRFTDNPDINRYLRTHLDCEVVTVSNTVA